MTYRVRCFGSFQMIAPGGGPVRVSSRKGQVLVALLLLAAGSPVARLRISALLWPDRPEEQARSCLRQELAGLKRALPPGERLPFLVEGDSIAADPVRTISDLAPLLEGGDIGAADLAALGREPFLAGLSFAERDLEDWLAFERSRLHRLRLEAVERAASLLEQRGDFAAAAAAGHLALELDPCSEAACRLVMRCHALLGERHRALRVYREHEAALGRELAVAPDRETVRLFERIAAAGSDAPDGPVASAPTPSPRRFRPSVLILPALDLTPDGDRAGVDELTRGLAGALRRFTALSVVSGSTMLGHARDSLAPREAAHLTGARYVLEATLRGTERTRRVTVQCAAVDTGEQVWSRSFGVEADDRPFDLEAIAGLASGNLYHPLMTHAIRVSRAEVDGGTDALYLQTFHHIERPTASGMLEARLLCRRILEIEPEHALTREHLAWIELHSALNGWADDPWRALARVREQALLGVGRAETEAYLVSILGLAEVLVGRHRQGLGWLRRAIELNPYDPEVHAWLGAGLAFAGRPDQSHAPFDRAEELSPGYPPVDLFRGDALLAEGRFEEAIDRIDRFLVVLPEYNYGRLCRAAALAASGDLAAAGGDVEAVAAEAPALSGRYLESLLTSRPDHFALLWKALSAAGLRW